MINKDLRSVETTLFLNKLDRLLDQLRIRYEGGVFSTQEEVVQEFLRLIQKFYDDLKTPMLKLRPALKGTPPSRDSYNASFVEIRDDLEILFRELNTLEGTILQNFNFMVSERDKVNKLLKRVNSKVGDYILYSDDPIGNAFYFRDSFNDTSKIDFGSSLLKEEQCEISQAEGIITLPAVRDGASSIQKAKVKINAEHSNGTAGNNQEIGANPHNNIDDILDSNPDTWFEYERVQRSRSTDDVSLRLDITMYFDVAKVINFIRINPNNFGTQNSVSIDSIDTSFDGSVWTSIKDDIPIAGFLQEDEENIFKLAPSTSKYAGQGLYTFTPRKVKYVRILFSQNTPHLINTPAGEQWRYAIGLRDIELRAVQYQSKGDIISQPFYSTKEIQKISLLASENPAEASDLADVSHQVSVDDGGTWHEIQPQDRDAPDIPEILNINTGEDDSVETATPVYSVRHRMVLSRDSDQFKEGSSTLKRTVKSGVDILRMPTLSPVVVSLTRSPVVDTVSVMNPLWGVRRDLDEIPPSKHIIGVSNGQSGQRHALPELIGQKIRSGQLSRSDIVIWIDNDKEWSRVGKWDSVGQYDKSYVLDITPKSPIIQFGNGDESDPKGLVPPSGSYISFTLAEEQLQPTASSPHKCELVFPCDGDASSVRIYRKEKGKSIVGETLTPGASVFRLRNKNLDDSTTPTFSSSFGSEQTYVDGASELSASDDYSIDYKNGIVYRKTALGATASVTISYTYIPHVELARSDWYFVQSQDNIFTHIALKDSGYSFLKDGSASATATYKVVDLGTPMVKPGSLQGVSGILDTPFEVPFIDGAKEFVFGSDEEVDTSGYYSVDYRRGKMYFAGTVQYTDTLTFSYTQIYAEYNIAKTVDRDKYTVDTKTQTISIEENEVIKTWGIRDREAKNDLLLKAVYDYVLTTRESIEELEPYFSPIVREYALKVLPKGTTQ